MGERFGNYELIEKVAVGGMAEIFKAKSSHGRGVEKMLCIKRIHPALSADRTFVTMFVDEARLGVTLSHGNIVPVFDFGYVDGHYFLAMEFVDGTDLATLRGRAKVVKLDWPPALALYVLSEILEGLHYAHNKRDENGRSLNLVHRDVSPSNVLISHDGQVKLLDFGIARSMAREHETRTGVVKGKPGYMSPEQAAAKTVDVRADIWACGAVFHELVTGQKLRDGRRRADDPLIDALLDGALAPDPAGRFASAAVFQKEVGDILDVRGWRPSSSDLATFVGAIRSCAAPGENWDMRSTSVEKHLADALGEDEPSGTATAVMSDGGDVSVETRVDTPPVGAGSGAKILVPTAITIVVGLAFAIWWFGVGTDKTLTDTSPLEPVVRDFRAPDPPDDPGLPRGDDAGTSGTLDAGSGAKTVPTVTDAGVPGSSPSGAKKATVSKSSAKKKAILNLSSDPMWAEVTLDGKNIGKTPILNYRVSPGSHKVVFSSPYAKAPFVRTFTVAPGEEKIITGKMK